MRHELAGTLAMVLGFFLLTLLLTACGTASPAPGVPTTAAVATATVPITSDTLEPMASGTPAASAEGSGNTTAEQVAEAAASRTPAPTRAAGPIERQVDQLARVTGLQDKSFLGLTVEDWINLAISALLVVLVYLVGVRLLFGLLKWAARRTSTEFDDAFLDTIEKELRGLVLILVAHYALLRLDFWSHGLRTAINDVLFVLGIIILVIITLKLISFAVKWYQDKLEPDKDRKRLDPIIAVVERMGYVLVIIIGLSIGLSHFGVDVTMLSVTLVVGGAVIVLGARDVIADAISGFIILLDQPFRVGDVVEIEDLGMWGDVIDIGTRTTRIRSRDNRFVIVPNSKVSASRVINYTFPDPRYRVHSEIGVAYGSDFDQVRSVTEAAVRGVAGVLPDKPVDAYFHEFGASSRLMRVRWWINDMHAEKRIIDGVNEALEIAFDKAGIDLPLTTQSVIVQVDPKTMEQIAPSPHESDPAGD